MQKYIASAADHIQPEYAPIFELTARAVRAGALEWHVAATRLAAYYAPRKSGEGVIDFILDLTPVVGQIKAVKELVEGVQDAIDARAYGDQRAFDSAIEKAAGAGISLLGGVGIAGAGARQLARELHHIIPLYLGGFQNSPTIELSRFLHRTLHRRMQAHFNTVERGLAHRSGYGRLRIQEIFVPQKRLEALDQFYRTLERSRWTSLRKAAEEWRKIFPEAAKYIK